MFFHRAEVASIELYGKLPLAKDYLRVGCAQGAGAAWRDWLDHAYSGGAGGTFPALAAPLHYVTGTAWGEPLVGALWPSSDAGGLRKFPFTCFVERRRKLAAKDLDDGLGRAAAIWDALDLVHAQAASHGDGQRFLAALRGREIDVDALTPKPRAALDFGAWKQAIDGSDDGLARIFGRLGELRRNAPRKVLRLPLANDLDPREQALAWWRLCAELGLLDARELPTLLFPAAPVAAQAPAFVVFAARPFVGADVLWLAPPTDAAIAGLDDLSDPRPRRTSAPNTAPEHAPALSDSLRGAWTEFAARGR